MKRSKIIIALFLLAGLSAMAAPVGQKRAAAVANHFWMGMNGAKSSQTPLEDRTSEWPYAGIYLFTHPDGGFVLVAGDDNAKPILGYSSTGRLDPASLPPSLAQWLEGYQQQLDALAALPEGSKCAYGSDAAEWQLLESGMHTAKGADTAVVGPLLTCNWDQTYPYNVYCPKGTVTGCAATAQAQMMYFWKFPAFGEGAHSYVSGNYGLQSADFSHTLFAWDEMKDVIASGSTATAIQAVGTLMYTLGVSLEMNYGTAAAGGSSALGLVGASGYHSIDNSLQDYFHYSRDMYVEFKANGYSNEEWRDLLMAELDLGHPILYGGYAEQGGHGFVCDGYDSRQYMHFNFGWSGVGDGYYPVDSISPGVGGAGGNVTYTFNQNNSALIGAVPLYAMHVSDTLFNFVAVGGRDSLLFSRNDTLQAPWTVSCDADWVMIDTPSFANAGWVAFEVDEMTTTGERVAWLTFSQGTESLKVKLVQGNYDTSEMCVLTVVMECTRDEGWRNDAHLTLESASGYLFGTARLESGSRDSVEILVAPSDVYAVWHSGGGTDRYINYYVRNSYGQDCVAVEYAYLSGGRHHIVSPCEMLAVEEAPREVPVKLYPNPVGNLLHVDAEGLQRVEIMDMAGRVVLSATNGEIGLRQLPSGTYFVRIVTDKVTEVKRIVKR